MVLRTLFLMLLLSAFMPLPPRADTWIVDPGGSGDFTTIQAALAAASDGDQILVQPGTYIENVDFLGKDLVLRSTTGPASTIIDGSAGPPGAASCVRFTAGESAAAVLEGFTLTGGTGSIYRGRLEDGVEDVHAGGGLYCRTASPTIRDCVIAENTAEYAAGMLVAAGNPQVIQCLFASNAAGNYGGGIAGPMASPLIQDCVFEGNSAGYGSAAVHLLRPARIERCEFRENRAYIAGAVNASEAGADLQIVDCLFVQNTAHGSDGAALRIHEASVSVTRCLFAGNSAALTGGGVFVLDGGHALVSQSTFYGNAADRGGTSQSAAHTWGSITASSRKRNPAEGSPAGPARSRRCATTPGPTPAATTSAARIRPGRAATSRSTRGSAIRSTTTSHSVPTRPVLRKTTPRAARSGDTRSAVVRARPRRRPGAR